MSEFMCSLEVQIILIKIVNSKDAMTKMQNKSLEILEKNCSLLKYTKVERWIELLTISRPRRR